MWYLSVTHRASNPIHLVPGCCSGTRTVTSIPSFRTSRLAKRNSCERKNIAISPMWIENYSTNLSLTCWWPVSAVVSRYFCSDHTTLRNLAFEDAEWKAINQKVDTIYIVEDFPEPICGALMPSLAPSEDSVVKRSWGYARAEHLLELRDLIQKQPLASTKRIVAWAGTLLEKEARLMRLLEERERKKRRRTKEGGEQSNSPVDQQPPDQPVSIPEQAMDAQEPEPFVLVIPRRTVQGFSTNDLLKSSPVAESKIIRSTSSKLNYILNEVAHPIPSFDSLLTLCFRCWRIQKRTSS